MCFMYKINNVALTSDRRDSWMFLVLFGSLRKNSEPVPDLEPQDGSETCYGLWFRDGGTTKKS